MGHVHDWQGGMGRIIAISVYISGWQGGMGQIFSLRGRVGRLEMFGLYIYICADMTVPMLL